MPVFAITLFPLIMITKIFGKQPWHRSLWEIACGFFCSLPATLLVQLGRTVFFRINWAFPVQIFCLVWFGDFLVFSFIALFCVSLFIKYRLLNTQQPLSLWFLAYFFLPVLVKILYKVSFYGAYEYFYYPVLCLCLAKLFAFQIFKNPKNISLKRICLLSVSYTLIPAVVAFLYYMQLSLWSLCFFGGFVILSVILIFWAWYPEKSLLYGDKI